MEENDKIHPLTDKEVLDANLEITKFNREIAQLNYDTVIKQFEMKLSDSEIKQKFSDNIDTALNVIKYPTWVGVAVYVLKTILDCFL